MTAHPGPRWRVARSLLGAWRSSYLWVYVLALAVTAAGIAVAIDRFGTLEGGTWGWTVNHVRFVVGVTGMVMVQAVKLCVANGITRRDGTLGLVGGAIGLAALAGGLIAAGHGVEWLVHGGSDTVALTVTSATELLLAWLATTALLLAYLVSGWLIAVGYLRLGWVAATFAIVPALLPVVAVELVWGVVTGLDGLFTVALEGALGWPIAVEAAFAVTVSILAVGGGVAALLRASRRLPFPG